MRKRELNTKQEVEAILMSKFYPRIAPGHGSQHKSVVEGETTVDHRCSAKDCHPESNTRHKQDIMSAAARFILERDR